MGEVISLPSSLPERFGGYTILGHLATGGMAEVYLARKTGLEGFEKVVVIKRVRPELMTDAAVIAAFLDEARLVASLQHPSIAQVYEIGQVAGAYFLVMEYVHGADLRQLMHRSCVVGRRITIADAIYIAIQACIALHYAHEKRGADGRPLEIIHRDVSPSNVLVSHDGTVKVCDFGIAKASNQSTHTERGTIKGKYAYMSPEQCRGMELDRRSDIFALGVLLYELSTLTRAFKAPSDFEVLRLIVEHHIELPSQRVLDYPPDLERIVLRAMAKRPEDRYPTAQAMQLELEALAREYRLALSSVNIAAMMSALFNEQIDAWIQAQRAGRKLAEHLVDTALRLPGQLPVVQPTDLPLDASACSIEVSVATSGAVPRRMSGLADAAGLAMSAARPAVPPPALTPLPESVAMGAVRPSRHAIGSDPVPVLPPTLAVLAGEPSAIGSDMAAVALTDDAIAAPGAASIAGPLAATILASSAAPMIAPGVTAIAPAPEPRRRPSPIILLSAAIALVVAIAASLFGRMFETTSRAVATAALEADGARVSSAIDLAIRSAKLRALGIAEMPLMRSAIQTDAATIKDLSDRDRAFVIGDGEVLEIYQRTPAGPVSLLRLPDGAPPLVLPAAPASKASGATARLDVRGDRLFAITSAMIDGDTEIDGDVAVAAPIDLSPAIRTLAPRVSQAALRIGDREVALIAASDPARAPIAIAEIALATTSQRDGDDLVLRAAPNAATNRWIRPTQAAAIAGCIMFLAWYLLASARARR